MRYRSVKKAEDASRKLALKHTRIDYEIILQEPGEILSQAEAKALRYAAKNRTP